MVKAQADAGLGHRRATKKAADLQEQLCALQGCVIQEYLHLWLLCFVFKQGWHCHLAQTAAGAGLFLEAAGSRCCWLAELRAEQCSQQRPLVQQQELAEGEEDACEDCEAAEVNAAGEGSLRCSRSVAGVVQTREREAEPADGGVKEQQQQRQFQSAANGLAVQQRFRCSNSPQDTVKLADTGGKVPGAAHQAQGLHKQQAVGNSQGRASTFMDWLAKQQAGIIPDSQGLEPELPDLLHPAAAAAEPPTAAAVSGTQCKVTAAAAAGLSAVPTEGFVLHDTNVIAPVHAGSDVDCDNIIILD
jgi:hypothetical protein